MRPRSHAAAHHRVRALRLARHWTLTDLARRLRISEARLSQIEQGRFGLSAGMAARMALVFGLPDTTALYVHQKPTDSDK